METIRPSRTPTFTLHESGQSWEQTTVRTLVSPPGSAAAADGEGGGVEPTGRGASVMGR